ncbi:polysaccharide deacetylase family protein [Parahaliea mediterranea]|uniref:Polysaccharide deacetylase family protein n=1 Tax=Parahaliea mediterranea TaxID=651086 RepID=A0A939DHW4_9GAMM|nr:polysaccharide deacetylase family protein [Parahaliea mediterranea]MBN7797827.1 polysaccharide deacetylase family protein [Parahaliea mediterranea]
MKRGLGIALLCLQLFTAAVTAAEDHAVILLYHRVSDTGPASTRISPEQFQRHLDWIDDNGFQVVPLARLLEDIEARGETVDNAVAITFDDAYASVYDTAYPALRDRGMPFSVFVATQSLDAGFGQFMTWSQAREMQRSGLATFGSHSLSHDHLEARREGETPAAWKARVRGEIQHSHQRIEEALGTTVPMIFAYPFGEYSRDSLGLVQSLGFAGLAQQSGALGPRTPRNQVPRFAMSQNFGSLERLEMALKSRPLPAREAGDQPHVLRPGEPLPKALLLQIQTGGPAFSKSVNCFAASGEGLVVEREESTIAVKLPALAAGRNKINCTAPTGQTGEYYWFSRLWVVADESGNWLNN